MEEKTARKYVKAGKLPSQMGKSRHWRTHPDAFGPVWEEEEKILERSPTVEAKTLFEYLCRTYEGSFQEGQLRTLQKAKPSLRPSKTNRGETGIITVVDQKVIDARQTPHPCDKNQRRQSCS